MIDADALRLALLRADPKLSKFNPLSRIVCFDDFDNGVNGWAELIGNTDGNLDNMPRYVRDFHPAQLSTCTYFDQGTHGPMSGTYVLKAATRPVPDHTAVLVKRLTWQKLGLVQMEMYFSYKSEWNFEPVPEGGREWDGNYHPSEAQFGDIMIGNDIQIDDEGRRTHCALRYVNADAQGNLIRRWKYKTSLQVTRRTIRSMFPDDYLDRPLEDFQVQDPADWEDVPDGYQPLCYNEIPSKVNWHYLRWVFDIGKGRNVELQVNDKVMDLRDIPVPAHDSPYWGLARLLNLEINVRTRVPVRNFLYVDSMLISADW